MNKEKWLWIAIGVVFGVVVTYAILVMDGKKASGPETAIPPGVACTMEARQCPDGSYVGRQGPKCEFAPCPGPSVEIQVK